ncbi:unnamed protein product [Echinostoma caproni]|uniref:PPP1R35_C domain-containing protein n=1 Tax=Echinostoma caproni TaxID=27848 RepID=A0A183AGL3_9TREM|nr:unnamed protein product [Echinostoma caproni]
MANQPVNDLSLISELSEPGDTLHSFNVLHSHLLGDVLAPRDRLPATRSPLASESSSSTSVKQVRFNESVTVSAAVNCSSSLAHPSGHGDYDETDVTTVTPLHVVSQSEDFLSKVYSPRVYSNPRFLDDPSVQITSNEAQSANTSLWLESSNEVKPRLVSPGKIQNTLALSVDVDQSSNFFRTSDHLPRPPPHYNSSNSSHNTALSSADPLALPESVHSPGIEIPVPRASRISSRSWESLSSLSSMVTDTLTETSDDGVTDLSKPKANTTRHLADQIHRLTERLSSYHLDEPGKKAWQEAERLVKEATVCSNTHNQLNVYTPNPSLTVNIPEQVSTYTNLMDLSVDESEIVRQERERVAEQRRRMAQLRRQEAKKKPQIPKPDLFEFFDPNRHVFQSVNLHFKGLPTFLPVITTASQEMMDVFHDRAMIDFCRLYM